MGEYVNGAMMRWAGGMYMCAMSGRGVPRGEPAGAAVAASVIAKLAISLLGGVWGSASRRSPTVVRGYFLFALFIAAQASAIPACGVDLPSMILVTASPNGVQ